MIGLYVMLGIQALLIGVFAVRLYKLENIYKAFDEVIIKTLSDTKYIEENKKFVTNLTNYAETAKKINEIQIIELKKQISNLNTVVKELSYNANKKG